MKFKKTKIICTIGPASFDPKVMKALALVGMNVARLNLSHGTHEEKREQIQTLRKIANDINQPITIVADLQGPKLRLGKMDGIRQIKKGEKINLSITPSENELPMQFDLSPYVKKGQRIFLNDGLVELKVLEVKDKVVKCEAVNSGWVSSNKGVNIPETQLPKAATFTPKDIADAEFAIKENVDFLALSFVQTVEDMDKAKNLIKKYNSKVKIIAKIEKREAIKNLEQIIYQADAVMVARGDLGIETSPAEVPIMQQKIIRIARQYQKPVIVATQMLESMTENPRPTRAEASDVANAVLSQVDAVMLSAESASGKYPIEAVTTMNDIILSVEENPEFHRYIKINWENISSKELHMNAIASSAASLAFRISSPVIAAATASGRMARLISSFRPDATIVAATHDEQTRNQLNLMWGIQAVVVLPAKQSDKFWKSIITVIKKNKFAKKWDRIIMVSGSTVGVSGATDTIKVATL